MTVWHLLPRNRKFGAFLEHMTTGDDGPTLYVRPWDSLSIVISGKIVEVHLHDNKLVQYCIPIFRPVYWPADKRNKLFLMRGKPAWLLVFTWHQIREVREARGECVAG